MATCIWTGSLSGAWHATNNWSPNALPSTGDTVIIPLSAGNNLTDSLDRGGDVYTQVGTNIYYGLNLASLIVVEGSKVQVGTAAAPLMCTCDKLEYYGDAQFHFWSSTRTGTQKTDQVILKPSSGNNAISIFTGSNFGTNTNTGLGVVRMDVLRGNVTIQTSTGLLTNMFVAPELGADGDLNVTMTGPGPASMLMQGGTVYADGATSAVLRSGTLVSTGAATNEYFTSLYQTGGYCDYSESGGASNVWLMGGQFDASKVRSSGGATVGTIYLLPGVSYLKNNLLSVTGSEITIGE